MADIISPVGRIVWGNPLNGRPKQDQLQKPIFNEQGQPVVQWSFGLAISKQEAGAIFAAMQQEAATVFPNGTPQNFAWKFKDGDGLDDKGQPFGNREGYKGCVVISIVTEAYAPRVVRWIGGAYQQWTEVKTGDYVRVAMNIKAHAGKVGVRGSVPGLYVNPQMIEFVGFGQEIISGPDAASLFGGQAVALPQGASATPLAPAGNMPTGAPMQNGGMQGMMPQGQPMQNGGMPGMMPNSQPGNMQPGMMPNSQPGMMPTGAPMQNGGMQGMMQGNPQTPVGAYPAGNGPTGATPTNSGNAVLTFPSNPSPHTGFVNGVIPGMLPQ